MASVLCCTSSCPVLLTSDDGVSVTLLTLGIYLRIFMSSSSDLGQWRQCYTTHLRDIYTHFHVPFFWSWPQCYTTHVPFFVSGFSDLGSLYTHSCPVFLTSSKGLSLYYTPSCPVHLTLASVLYYTPSCPVLLTLASVLYYTPSGPVLLTLASVLYYTPSGPVLLTWGNDHSAMTATRLHVKCY